MPETDEMLGEVALARDRVRLCVALKGWNPALIMASITPSVQLTKRQKRRLH